MSPSPDGRREGRALRKHRSSGDIEAVLLWCAEKGEFDLAFFVKSEAKNSQAQSAAIVMCRCNLQVDEVDTLAYSRNHLNYICRTLHASNSKQSKEGQLLPALTILQPGSERASSDCIQLSGLNQ